MAHTEPIRLHPQNPHYLEYGGKPTLLITSAEHYGAVVNLDFDYVAYLDALVVYRLNDTRIYPGFLFEPADKFIRDNTLAPRPEALILPWARSTEPGYVLGGTKFDLDTWDAAFFRRLSDFLASAEERGIVVEICFFNCQYPDTWPLSPLHMGNNIQGVGTGDHNAAQTLDDPALAHYETEYVREIVRAANPFGNVILEVCDEPILLGTPIAAAGAWIAHMVAAIREVEAALPHKHLIAQQVEGPLGGPCDFSGHPDVDVIVSQYVWEASAEQEGGMKALEEEYGHNKPIELNETAYYPVWYKGDKEASSRVEAWEFIVGGGASFNHLNGVFTVHNPAGVTPENAQVCGALRSLVAFMESLDFLRMVPERNAHLVDGSPHALLRGLSEPGQQYALYVHHSEGARAAMYIAQPGRYTETIVLSLPAGRYAADWVDPASGSVVQSETIVHAEGDCTLTTPLHMVDIALRLMRCAVDPDRQ
jgi:hypothetical protein